MKDRSVNSYDLKDAQEILATLAPSTGTSARQKPVSDSPPEYLRLSKEFSAQKSSRIAAQPGEDLKAANATAENTQPQKFTSWESCIAWCMSTIRAEAAFVVDSQGFIIASRGRVPGQGFEGTGAELVCSVEQLERVAPDAGKLLWVDLDFDKRRVVALITPSESSEYFVVGFIAPDSAFSSLKQHVTNQIIDNLPHLD
ncbi:MAG: hypothetical protein EG828_04390 [Deltaproteobacteria bacterium]|nr:hypothetical protein [Deltaproteobacteria bacterium]